MALRILMIGWEFPPYLNGGLGVATQGLAQALAPLVDLTLLIPRSRPSYRAEGYRLLGMHGQSLAAQRESYEEKEIEWLREVRVTYLPVDISGYERFERQYHPIEKEHWLQVERVINHEREVSPAKQFFIEELYGQDLRQKVIEFTEMALAWVPDDAFDVIHAHDWMTFLLGLELKARSGKPLVLHVHSLEYDRGGPESRNGIFELEQHALQQADAVVPVSAYTADILARIYGVPEARLHPVSNGIAPFEGYRKPRPFPEPLITFLGRVTAQKGPEHFLRAAQALLKLRPHVRFAVAGRGDAIEALIEQTAAARLGDRFHFTGHLEDGEVRDLLAMSEIFVLPSRSEPFGLAALEAAQMGVPCLVSQNSGVAEVLPAALTVDYDDPKAMAQAMLALLEDPALREQVLTGQRANLHAVSWPTAARNVFKIYQGLLHSS